VPALSVIGYPPPWAVEDPLLVSTHQGQEFRGSRRPVRLQNAFVRDGHQTVWKIHQRLHYEREKLAQFEAISMRNGRVSSPYELRVTAC